MRMRPEDNYFYDGEGIFYVFRGDRRSPSFRRAHRGRGSSKDLYKHTINNTDPPSVFVSTSYDEFRAAEYSPNHIYVIRPMNGIDVNATFGGRHVLF